MKMQKTIAGLSLAAMTLAAATAAPAATFVSGPGTTTVTGAGISGSITAPVILSHDPLISGASHPYNTTSIPGAQWVTAFTSSPGVSGDAYRASSAANGGSYTFTQAFTSLSTPFQINGTLLSDNALLGIVYDQGMADAHTYTISDLQALGDTYTADQKDSNNTGANTAYRLAFNFGAIMGINPPDAHTLGFVVQNQTQSSPTAFSNPASIDYSFNVSPSAVPEPGTVASFGFGGFGLLGLALRTRRRSVAAH